MAISGGALVPLLMGKLVDLNSVPAFIVPTACFAYLMVLSLRTGGKPATTTEA